MPDLEFVCTIPNLSKNLLPIPRVYQGLSVQRKWMGNHTKRFLVGSEVNAEDRLLKAPIDWRLAIETVSSPATKAVNAKAAVAKQESTNDIAGTESVNYWLGR